MHIRDLRRPVAMALGVALTGSLLCGAAFAQAPAAPAAPAGAAPAAPAAGAAPAAPAVPAVPRTADGHPSLTGLWGGASGALPTGEGVTLFAGRGGTFYGFEEDNGLARMATLNKPVYKPQYWDCLLYNSDAAD